MTSKKYEPQSTTAVFISDSGPVTVQVTEDLTRYVQQGYLLQWVPGVYEFTPEGREYFATREGMI